MRETTVPARITIAPEANIAALVVQNAVKNPHGVQFRRENAGRWEDVTARDFLAETTALAKGLVAAGINPGDRVALMSRTRYEWTLADFAIWTAGAVCVPIYETSSAEQVDWILEDSGAVACFVEQPAHLAIVEEVRGTHPALQHVWGFEAGAIGELVSAGKGVDDAEVERRRNALTSSTLATLIYTSGTTGRPKGCELTHGNFLASCENVTASMGEIFGPGASTLLFLPLAHVFARAIQVGCVAAGVTMGHTPDVKTLLPDLAVFRPTFVLSVPRVFEKIYNGAQAKATADGKGKIFDRAAGVAIAYSRSLDTGGPGLALRVQHAVFDRLVYSKLRALMGGQTQWAVSGGAALGERLGHFFRGIGITILEGYGLTETSAASTVNRPDAISVGSVGQAIPSVSLAIADDGEVLIKGPHVFTGYWNNPAATAEAISPDGWFRSGDIGMLDDRGFLSITGRKKEILVTSGGKNVAPAVLEDRLRAHPLVSQCMVVGDAQPFIACLVTLDPEAAPAWLAAHGRPADTPMADLVDDPEVRAAVQTAVDDANKAVSAAEAIKKFTILPIDFTETGGQLTPSMKLKRAVVAKEFSADIAALYH